MVLKSLTTVLLERSAATAVLLWHHFLRHVFVECIHFGVEEDLDGSKIFISCAICALIFTRKGLTLLLILSLSRGLMKLKITSTRGLTLITCTWRRRTGYASCEMQVF